MIKNPRLGRTLPAVIFAIAAALATAAPAAAQTEELPLNRETITKYAHTHRAMNDARDEFHGKVGRIHDEQGRARARQELEERIQSILEEHEMTREQYDYMTLAISMDGEARTMFDEIMAELETSG